MDLGNYPLPKPVCLQHLPDGLPVGRVLVGGEAFSFGTAVAVVFLIAFLYLLFRPAKKYDKETVMSVDAK